MEPSRYSSNSGRIRAALLFEGGGLMVTHLVYAVLAIVLAAMAVLAITAISKIEEPGHHS